MTITLSQISRMIPRSWEIRMTEVPSSWFSFWRSCRIWAWIVTSSAVVGSSAMITSGRLMRAMAMTTRCRIPPDS